MFLAGAAAYVPWTLNAKAHAKISTGSRQHNQADASPLQGKLLGDSSQRVCQVAHGPFRVVGSKVIDATGTRYIPYGITLSDFQDNGYNTSSGVDLLHNEIDATAGAWCSNTVRLQVEQDTLVGTSGKTINQGFLTAVKNAVTYAESRHLIVVINDQTEPGSAPSTNEPLPTIASEDFWSVMNATYADDPNVIYDLFNEPRTNTTIGLSNAIWSLWLNGGSYNGGQYIGMQTLADFVRNNGSKNVFWVEGMRYSSSFENISNYLIKNDGAIVYALHHPTGPHNPANWDQVFGNFASQANVPVVDGEWSNWASSNSECWPDAPTAAPTYLSYLAAHNIGMTVWTLRQNVMVASATNLNVPTSFGSNWGCSKVLDEGAGSIVQAWYYQQNSVATSSPSPSPSHSPVPSHSSSPSPSTTPSPVTNPGPTSGSGPGQGNVVLAPPGSKVAVDGVPISATSELNTTYLTNGVHTISVTKDGKTTTEVIDAHNQLNPFQTLRNFLFARYTQNHLIMNLGTVAVLILILAIATGLIVKIRKTLDSPRSPATL